MKKIDGGITAPEGFKSAGVACGIKESNKKDIALIYSENGAEAAAVFTKNKVQAAPVIQSRKNIKNRKAKAIIINSGNANACTGKQGLIDARKMCDMTAKKLMIDPEEVLVASTGIIGKALEMDKIEKGIYKLISNLDYNGKSAAEAILTTDTCTKEIAFAFYLPEQDIKIKVGAMAKGSGMIHPDMATMLAFITTDLSISGALLQQALKEAVNISFNRISVDGDQSTNDSVFLMANGQAGNKKIIEKNRDYQAFVKVLKKIATYLAKTIIADGEGATKFITIKVKEAESKENAEAIARKVANSNLVKTACFGQDPNWGRILAAIGSSGVDVDPDRITVKINGYILYENGLPLSGEKHDNLMEDRNLEIAIILHNGNENIEFWTSDLSYEYIEINAEYHT